MRKAFYFICFSMTWTTSCGPDLNPQEYLIKSILLGSLEEYSFQYAGERLQKLTGTDSITLNYTYFKDSTSILHLNKSGRLFQRTRLVYTGNELTKVKVTWRFSQAWYRDSILFSYSGSNLSALIYKKLSYQVAMQNGNLTSIRRGLGGAGVSYAITYDQLTNPLESVYWLDSFILPSGFTTVIQPNAIARYFSKNNISTTTIVSLGATEIDRYFYTYLHGILPKSINLEREVGLTKISGLVYLFDIQYLPRAQAGSSP
jgi:hypothetical protein